MDFWVLDTAEAVELYARVPVEALRDIALPLRGPGYLDLARAEEPLREGIELWLLDALTLRRNGEALARGTLEALRVALPSDRRFLGSVEGLPGYFAAPPLQETEEIFWEQAVVDVAVRFPPGEGALSFQAPLGTLGLDFLAASTRTGPAAFRISRPWRGDAESWRPSGGAALHRFGDGPYLGGTRSPTVFALPHAAPASPRTAPGRGHGLHRSP